MKTSARNQFTGTLSEVIIGAVNAEVHVGLKGGETIAAELLLKEKGVLRKASDKLRSADRSDSEGFRDKSQYVTYLDQQIQPTKRAKQNLANR